MPDPAVTPARLVKLIKEFRFLEEVRSRLTLDADVRLNPSLNLIQLKATDGLYPLDDDLTVKTWVANPGNVRQWLGFQVSDEHEEDEDGVVTTSLGFRLSDGTDEFLWDGAGWIEDNDDWNTEAEIAAHISTFSVTSKRIQVVVNLKTIDDRHTPKLYSIKILYTSDILFQEDIVLRSLVRKLKSDIRPLGRHVFTTTSTLTTVLLNSTHKMDTPYNVALVEGVYNHTDDPEHLINLATTFNPTTGVVTLGSTFPTAHVLWLDFRWEPEVSFTTSQDYSEVAKVPALILESVNLVDCVEQSQYDSVIDRSTGHGWKIHAPLRGSLEISLLMLTDKATDQLRLADEMKRFFMSNPTLLSFGLDEEYRLWLIDEYKQINGNDRSDVQSGKLMFRIVDVLFYMKEAVEVCGVQNVVWNLESE
jgi:hypothetical protein